MCEYCGIPVDGEEKGTTKVITSTLKNGEVWVMTTNVTKPFMSISLDNAIYARFEHRKYMYLTGLFDINFCPMCGANLIEYIENALKNE